MFFRPDSPGLLVLEVTGTGFSNRFYINIIQIIVMAVGIHCLHVMRRTLTQDPGHHLDPASMHSLGYALVATTLLALGAVALTLAALYPITAAGVAVLAGVGWYAVRTFRRYYRTRRSAGWTRKVCVPRLGVCVEL